MNLELVSNTLGYIGIGSTCLPISLLLFVFKREIKYIDKLLLILAIEYAVLNIISMIIFTFTENEQSVLIGIHYFFETIVLSIFFLKTLSRKQIALAVIFIITGSILNILITNYLGGFNISKYITIFSHTILFVLSLNFILLIYNQNLSRKLTDSGHFIIGTGVLFFTGIQYYFTLFESYVRLDSLDIYYYLWPIFQIAGILYYLIFTYGLWKLKK